MAEGPWTKYQQAEAPTEGPWAKYANQSPAQPAAAEPSTTLGGLATATARGLAPTGVGATVGAGLGALVGGIPTMGAGAVPGAFAGAEIGAGLTSAAQFVYDLYNTYADSVGRDRAKSPQDFTDQLIDMLGGKPQKEASGLEHIVQAGAGGAGGAVGQLKAAEKLGEYSISPAIKEIAKRLADNPVVQGIGGALGGAGSQASAEAGFDNPIIRTLAGMAGASLGGAGTEMLSKPIGAGARALGVEPPQFVANHEQRPQVRAQNDAREMVSNAFNKGVSGGAPGALDVMERMRQAKEESQPYTLADVENLSTRGVLNRVSNEGGVPRYQLDTFFNKRDEGHRQRLRGALSKYLSNESSVDTGEELANLRSQGARPLWTMARQGGSLAPIAAQAEGAWVRAGQTAKEAEQEVAAAERNAYLAARQAAPASTRDNVYLESGARKAVADANQQLTDAKNKLSLALEDKQMAFDKMQAAQIDRATNAPGGIWSPHLQRIQGLPEIQAGLREGRHIEEMDAIYERRPFNASDYALDNEGNLLPHKVPNMGTWIVAKTGLDELIDQRLKNEIQRPGDRPSKKTVSMMNVRNSLVDELDKLNPDYAPARQHWNQYSSSMRALREGRNALDNRRFTPETLKQHFDALPQSDQEFFRIGLADDLRTKLRSGPNTADKTRIFNDEARDRIRMLMGDDEKAARFVNMIERESQTKHAKQNVMRSEYPHDDEHGPTAQKLLRGGGSLLGAAAHTVHGHPLVALGMGLRGLSNLVGRQKPNMRRNQAIVDLMTSPDVSSLMQQGSLAQGKGTQLFPLKEMPPTLPRRLLPGSVIGAESSFTPPAEEQ